jgi:hypothetical protein
MSRCFYIVALVVTFLASCGEDESICRKAFEVKYSDILTNCEKIVDRDDCFLCPCLCCLEAREYEKVFDFQGRIDLQHSYCRVEEECSGERLEWAKGCVDDKLACREEGESFSDLFAGLDPCKSPYSEVSDTDLCIWE